MQLEGVPRCVEGRIRRNWSCCRVQGVHFSGIELQVCFAVEGTTASVKLQVFVLAQFARDNGAPLILCGDFNAEVELVRAALPSAFVFADLSSERPSRLATPLREGNTIDQVAVLGGTIVSAAILDGAGLSDHNPVAACVLTA